MFNLNGASNIEDFFKASVADIIDMYDNERPSVLDDENIIDIKRPMRYPLYTFTMYHYIATINGHRIYIDENDNIYEYHKKYILFLGPFRKMTYIGKPLFIDDIALFYKTHSLYDYIMKKRNKYFEKKRLEALFKGA